MCFCWVILYLNGFEFWPHLSWDTVYFMFMVYINIIETRSHTELLGVF